MEGLREALSRWRVELRGNIKRPGLSGSDNETVSHFHCLPAKVSHDEKWLQDEDQIQGTLYSMASVGQSQGWSYKTSFKTLERFKDISSRASMCLKDMPYRLPQLDDSALKNVEGITHNSSWPGAALGSTQGPERETRVTSWISKLLWTNRWDRLPLLSPFEWRVSNGIFLSWYHHRLLNV